MPLEIQISLNQIKFEWTDTNTLRPKMSNVYLPSDGVDNKNNIGKNTYEMNI